MAELDNIQAILKDSDYRYLKNDRGKEKLDKNGHLIVDHDLHNYDGELADGISEAFIDWAKTERLSFWS